jgi:hypothetical protein
LVVDLESLSVEHKPHRVAPRPLPVVAPQAPAQPTSAPDEASTSDDDAPAATPSPAQKPKNSELPAAAHANPYTTGSDEPGL